VAKKFITKKLPQKLLMKNCYKSRLWLLAIFQNIKIRLKLRLRISKKESRKRHPILFFC